MPLAVTHQEPGWTNLRADATDLLKDTSALKVYSAVRELVATADPDVIAMLCAAFLFALDGHKLTKFPDESRVWYVVAETQYTLAVTGLEEPADPPPDVKENMGGENALLEQKELGVAEGPEKYAGKERGPAGIAKNSQNQPNSSATPKSSGPVAKVITKSAKYKPGPKLYSLRSKGPPPPLQARKRKAGQQVPKILPAEKRLAVDDNVVIEVEIPAFSPFKKARLETPAGPSKPRGKARLETPAGPSKPRGIPPKPILKAFLKRSAPQPMRGRAPGLRTPSTPRSKQVVGPPKDHETPERSPGSFARFHSPGPETNATVSLLNTPQPLFKDASFPPAPQPAPPPTFYRRTQSLIGPSFPAFSAIAADDARDTPMATNATAGHERPWYENTASGDQVPIAATLNTLFSSVPITKGSSASTIVHTRHTTSPPSPLTPSSSSQSFQLSSPSSTIVAEALARKISSQAKTLNLLFQGYDKERDDGDGENRTWSGSTERSTVASSITPGQVLAQAQAEKQRQQYLAGMAHASSDSSPALSTASVGTGAEIGTEQGTTTAKPVVAKRWSTEENARLQQGLEKHGFGKWKAIAEIVDTRNPAQCAKHARRLQNPDKSSKSHSFAKATAGTNNLLDAANAFPADSPTSTSSLLDHADTGAASLERMSLTHQLLDSNERDGHGHLEEDDADDVNDDDDADDVNDDDDDEDEDEDEDEDDKIVEIVQDAVTPASSGVATGAVTMSNSSLYGIMDHTQYSVPSIDPSTILSQSHHSHRMDTYAPTHDVALQEAYQNMPLHIPHTTHQSSSRSTLYSENTVTSTTSGGQGLQQMPVRPAQQAQVTQNGGTVMGSNQGVMGGTDAYYGSGSGYQQHEFRAVAYIPATHTSPRSSSSSSSHIQTQPIPSTTSDSTPYYSVPSIPLSPTTTFQFSPPNIHIQPGGFSQPSEHEVMYNENYVLEMYPDQKQGGNGAGDRENGSRIGGGSGLF